MATIASLSVSLTARTKKFQKGMKQASASIKSFAGGAIRAIAKIGALGTALAGVGGLAGMAIFIKQQIKASDTLVDTSQKLGIATDRLAGLRLASEIAGVSIQTTDMALQRMTRRVAEAAKGTGEAQGALKDLGLDAVALGRLSPDKIFLDIADAMSKVEGPGQRLRLAFKLFDSEGAALVNTLSMGREELERTMEMAKRFGLAFDINAAAKIKVATAAMTRFSAAMRGAWRTIAIRLLPFIGALADAIVNFTTSSIDVGRILTQVANVGVSAIGKIADAWNIANIGVENFRLGVLGALHTLLEFTGRESLFGITLAGIESAIGEISERVRELEATKPSEAIKSYFDNLMKNLDEAADRMRNLLEGNLRIGPQDVGDEIAKKSALKSAAFKQVSLSRFAIGGVSTAANKPQPIVSKQIDTTNSILDSIKSTLIGRTFTAVMGP